IGGSAFEWCTGLTSVNIPNSVTNIGESAFTRCTGLTSVDIPNSITTINEGTFSYCSNLTSIIIPPSVTLLENGAFYECCSLASIELPNSIKSIGDVAFFQCSSLTSIEIPNSVSIIGIQVFWECTSLKSVKISENLSEIGDCVWALCPNIETIEYLTKTPLEINTYLFDPEVYENATLTIPEGAKEVFLATEPWNKFLNITEIDLSGIEDLICDGPDSEIDYAAPYEVYNLNGVKAGYSADNLAPGLYIIRQGSVAKKIAVN
ncbi:MAG: leucine-rich repeat domain-containing protein, partial [Muribaculaceae bacterium]|nr:leucine-rich repeat domain-containing protein [Muribaculaceae bacterium]